MNLNRLKDFLGDPGERIGKYEILRKLGEGGMGVVYEAFDPDLKRAVALKVPKRADADRLRREATQAARLRHPNIVAIHEVGPDWIAMERVAGRTLAEALPSLKRSRRIAALAAVADAVAYAHDQGVIHGDLSPANILVEPGGRVLLADFGLSGLPEGVVAGTPGYSAPPGTEGQAADVHALGVIAREAGIPVTAPTARGIADELEGRLRRRKLLPLALIPLAGVVAVVLLWPRHGMDPELHEWTVKEEALTLALKREPKRLECWVDRAAVRLARTDYDRNRGRNPLPDYAGAEADLTQAIALAPAIPELYFHRGVVRTQRAVYKIRYRLDPLSDCAQAEEDLVRAGATPGADTWRGNLRFHRGSWRLKTGGDPSADFAAAEQDLTPAQDADRRMRRGRVRAYEKRFDLAEEDFQEAVRMTPQNVWAWTWRGNARLAAGDPAAAEAHFTSAIAARSTFSEAWQGRGNARFDRGEFAAAATDFQEAIRLDPSLESELAPRLQEALSRSRR